MANVILKCTNRNKFGTIVTFPIAGDVQISKDGFVEVDEAVAKILIDGGNKNYVYDSEDEDESDAPAKTKASKKVEKVEDEDDEEEEGEDDDEDGEDPYAELESMELPEIIELVKAAGFKREDYKKFEKKKSLMIAFLRKK